MSWIYKHTLRPLLFTQPGERIHNQTLSGLSLVSRSSVLSAMLRGVCGAPELPVEALGLHFPNPVGLAAGMDKEAVAVPAWEAMGFGHVELGAVTWHGQPGNPPPRVFRAICEEALVNRMGFNNPGAEAVGRALNRWHESGRWPRHPVGINLGKSKVTPLEASAEDYLNSFRRLKSLADFFVVNVSSPNTPNLRQLQDKAALEEILAALQRENRADGPKKPLLIKLAPDLTDPALEDILEVVASQGLDGVVATNTTLARPDTRDPRSRRAYAETGGLSGRPLRDRSTEVIRFLFQKSKGRVPIIGVGGIFNAADAWEKITAGATLVQVYTGLVYEGPTVAKAIVAGLCRQLERHGLKSLSEAVGSAGV